MMNEIAGIYNNELVTPDNALRIAQLIPFDELAQKGWEFHLRFRATKEPTELKRSEKLKGLFKKLTGNIHLEPETRYTSEEVWLSYCSNGDLKLQPHLHAKVGVHELWVHTGEFYNKISTFDRYGHSNLKNQHDFPITDIEEYKDRVSSLTFPDLISGENSSLISLIFDCSEISSEEARRFKDVDLHSDARQVHIDYSVSKEKIPEFIDFLFRDLGKLVQTYDQEPASGTAVCVVTASNPQLNVKGRLMSTTTSYRFKIFPNLADERSVGMGRRWYPLEKGPEVLKEDDVAKILCTMDKMGYEPRITKLNQTTTQ